MYLDNLLTDVFQDKDVPIALLRKYDLEFVLEKAVKSINDVLEHPPIVVTSLVGLAPTILVTINVRLAKIHDQNDKQSLELLMAEVTVHLLRKLMDKCDQPATALKEIKRALETASHISEYNFGSLLTLLDYDSLESSYKEDEVYYYDWTGKLHELDELADKLRRQGVIKSVKNFKELFKNHGNVMLEVNFERASLDLLVALFDSLKSRGLIIPRGCTGHFHALKFYGRDFDNQVLIKNEPKDVKKNAKKKPQMWEKTENKANDLLCHIAARTTPKSPRIATSKTDSI